MASQCSQRIPCIPEQYPKPNHLSSNDGGAPPMSSLGASYSPSPATLDSDGVLIHLRDFPPVAAVPLSDAAFVSESSTPLKGRVSSYDADHKSAIKSITCREIGALLVKEFHADLVLEHTTLGSELFPSNSFPYATGVPTLEDRNILSHMSKVWSTSRNNWKSFAKTESSVAQWLNAVGEEFSRVTKIPILRKWSPDSCNIPLRGAIPGTPLKSKPDIVLMDVIPPGLRRSHKPSWDNVDAFCEVTTQNSFHSTMKQTIYTKTHVLFSAQETRRFVCSLAFYGKELRLNVIDHEGIMYQKFSLDGGFDNALKIIRVIAGFMCGYLTSLGYDSTVSRNPDGTVNTIDVEDDVGNITTYRVLRRLHVATGIVGRCTRVWLGHELGDEKTQVVIKDAWPLESRSNLEEDALKHLKTVPGIPVLARSITVLTQYDRDCNCKDSTSIYRLAASTICSNRSRVHRRLVMLSVGVKLHHFRSLSELIGAFRDVVIIHHKACQAGVLHRDISINNIMLHSSSESEEQKGLLIDFDHAIFLPQLTSTLPMNVDGVLINDTNQTEAGNGEEGGSHQPTMTVPEGAQSPLERTGTPPFIANAVLLCLEPHAGNHDLESIFYALIYALTAFKGPGAKRKQHDIDALSSIPLLKWFDAHMMDNSFKDMARLKMGHLADFEHTILKKMDDYFQPLSQFLRILLLEFFPNREYRSNQMTHEKMITLFNDEYARLKDIEANKQDGRERKKRRIDHA